MRVTYLRESERERENERAHLLYIQPMIRKEIEKRSTRKGISQASVLHTHTYVHTYTVCAISITASTAANCISAGRARGMIKTHSVSGPQSNNSRSSDLFVSALSKYFCNMSENNLQSIVSRSSPHRYAQFSFEQEVSCNIIPFILTGKCS